MKVSETSEDAWVFEDYYEPHRLYPRTVSKISPEVHKPSQPEDPISAYPKVASTTLNSTLIHKISSGPRTPQKYERFTVGRIFLLSHGLLNISELGFGISHQRNSSGSEVGHCVSACRIVVVFRLSGQHLSSGDSLTWHRVRT